MTTKHLISSILKVTFLSTMLLAKNGMSMGATNPTSPRCPRVITMDSIREFGHCRILNQGTYELGSDITYEKESDSPIIIAADNVTLNLKGYKIIGITEVEKGLKSQATAIQAIGRSNILIDGMVNTGTDTPQVTKSEISGFFTAINIQGGRRNAVKGVFVRVGYFYGIRLGSEEGTVSNNVVAPLVGTTVSRQLIMPVAIQVGGKKMTVVDNSIAFRNERNIQGYFGITLVNAPYSIVSRNNFNNLPSVDTYYIPRTTGILTDSNIADAETVADANKFKGFVLGMVAKGQSKIRASNSVMSNVLYPYMGNIEVVSISN